MKIDLPKMLSLSGKKKLLATVLAMAIAVVSKGTPGYENFLNYVYHLLLAYLITEGTIDVSRFVKELLSTLIYQLKEFKTPPVQKLSPGTIYERRAESSEVFEGEIVASATYFPDEDETPSPSLVRAAERFKSAGQ